MAVFSKYIESLHNENTWKTVGIAAGATAVAAGLVCAWKRYQIRGLPPGPRGARETPEISHDTIEFDFVKLAKKYGDVFSIEMGSRRVVVLASHDMIKEALVKQAENFASRPPATRSNMYFMEFKDDVFTAPYSQEWNQNKAFILNCLRNAGFGQTKNSEEMVLDQTENLIRYIENLAADQKKVNLRNILPKATISIIFRIMMSKQLDFDDPQIAEISKVIRDFGETFSFTLVLDSCPRWWARLWHSKLVKQIKERGERIRDLARAEVDAHIASFNPDSPRDFIDNYLIKRGASDKDRLLDNVCVFLPDSSDTLPLGIEWVFLFLTYHQDILKKVAAEIDSVTSGNRQVTWADRSQMPYTQAAIRESLRLRSPLVMTEPHAPTKDTSLGGYRIPKGTTVFGLIYAAHRDPIAFPDPETYNPSRFLDSSGKLGKSDLWISFGLGRRRCPGEQIASITLFLIITNLVQRFDFQFPPGENPTLEPSQAEFNRAPQPFNVLLTKRVQNN